MNTGLPGPGQLWAAFRDRVQDLGLRGLRRTVQQLPTDPVAAVASLLNHRVPVDQQVGYLSRLLARDPGWAAHLKQREPRLIADLLAIRATFDVLASAAVGTTSWQGRGAGDVRAQAIAAVEPVIDLLGVTQPERALDLAEALDDRKRAAIWQRAWEQRYRNRLVDRVSTRAAQPREAGVPEAHVVMCIDVRSERFRRHLEAVGAYDTHGFAGFFGVAIRHETASGSVSDQCPVLLKPAFVITEDDTRQHGHGAAAAMRGGMVTSTARPASAFAVAEGLGVLAGLDALAQTAAPGLWGRGRDRLQPRTRGELGIGRLQLAGRTDDVQYGMHVAAAHRRCSGHAAGIGPGRGLRPDHPDRRTCGHSREQRLRSRIRLRSLWWQRRTCQCARDGGGAERPPCAARSC